MPIQSSEVNQIVARLQRYSRDMGRDLKPLLEYAAIPIQRRAQAQAPTGSREHFRYNTPKVLGNVRAPKGMGRVVARYKPGNLKRSVVVLRKLKRVRNAVLIGPNVSKGGGTFGGARTQGYYAHWMEFGAQGRAARPFMRPAFEASKGQVLKRLELGLRLRHQKFAKTTG